MQIPDPPSAGVLLADPGSPAFPSVAVSRKDAFSICSVILGCFMTDRGPVLRVCRLCRRNGGRCRTWYMIATEELSIGLWDGDGSDCTHRGSLGRGKKHIASVGISHTLGFLFRIKQVDSLVIQSSQGQVQSGSRLDPSSPLTCNTAPCTEYTARLPDSKVPICAASIFIVKAC